MKLPIAFATVALSAAAAAAQTSRPAVAWETYADTWVGTDGRGRVLPTFDDVGPPRADRTVAMFYYLWQDSHAGVVRDMAKVLHADPDARVPVEPDDWYYWGEPLLGYYLLSDPAVQRTHAAMLSDAGVDAILFDSSNGYTHPDQVRAVCQVYEQIRGTGQRTPRVGHLLHASVPQTTRKIYDEFYAKHLYPDLWFRWGGKPLLLTVPAETPADLAGFFTQRSSWAWHPAHGWWGDGRDRWAWVDSYPQAFGWHAAADVPEQVSVSAAQHPVLGIGRSYHDGREPPAGEQDPGAGLHFAEQWDRALAVSPPLVFLTNWNEWIAKGYADDLPKGKPRTFLGRPLAGDQAFFVDEFSPEYSRDIEPAANTPANDGVADNFYYQMVAGVRRYKGVRPIPPVVSRPIAIDGHFDDWHDVTPEFRDTIGDPVHRDSAGFAAGSRYVNQTGRNDIIAAKVSADATTVYFYVRTAAPMTPSSDPDWMLLYLDTDHDAKTGWLGYDFVVNRHVRPGRTSLERNVGGRYAWQTVADDVPFAVSGNEMELAIPRSALGLQPGPATVDFKWADHCFAKGDWTDFTLNGDAAPDYRFNYRAKLQDRAR